MIRGRSGLVFCFAATILSIAQAQSSSQTPQTPPEQPTFHIGVDAVRIDAVVTDSKGDVVTDLTADDFELKDDGRPQKVTLATFVPVASSATTPATARADAYSNAPPVVRPLARDEVQRSILILVDDLGMSFEGMHDSRIALHTFIDQSLLPTDLVALTHTGMYAGMQRQFTTDRRLLHAAVVFCRRGTRPA
jgi:VWFA-related protein